MVTFFKILFFTAETRAYVVMVETEPVLLPWSTSPKTLIWVSQGWPCQEQPALFGSLVILLGQDALDTQSKTPLRTTTCTGSDLSHRGRRKPEFPAFLPTQRELITVIVSWTISWCTQFLPFLSTTKHPWQMEIPLVFAVLQYLVSERCQMKHSNFLICASSQIM
jgi:hypothetical protein